VLTCAGALGVIHAQSRFETKMRFDDHASLSAFGPGAINQARAAPDCRMPSEKKNAAMGPNTP